MDRFEELQTFTAVVETGNFSDAAARLNLAMTYKDLGDKQKAQREFKALCDSGSSLCQQFRSYFE